MIEVVNNNSINIDSKNLELSSENKPEDIVHASFTGRTTFCELDEDNYNLFTTNRKIKFKNKTAENTFILFAVKTTSEKYYLGYCDDGNSVEDNGLFSGSMLNQEIKMLCNGYDLNNINSMFSYNTNLGNIVFTKNFKTNNVTDMRFMFSNCSLLKELNLSNFNTNNVTTMSGMFNMCSSLKKLNLSNFNTNNVTSMFGMFNRCSSLKELNLSNFNTNNVTDMRYMFFGCTALKKKNIITKDNKTLQNFENI